MTITVQEPKLRDYEGGAMMLRDSEGKATQITSADGKRVLWESDNQIEPTVGIQSDELPGVENTPNDRIVASASSVSTTDKTIPRKVVTPAQAQAMREARLAGSTIPEIAAQFGFGKTAVTTVLKGIKPLNNPVSQVAPIIMGDFSGVENTAMPYSVRNAICISLDAAAHQSILGEGSVKAFFEGYIVGFQSALAIICGAAGIDISFLEEGHDDNSPGQ